MKDAEMRKRFYNDICNIFREIKNNPSWELVDYDCVYDEQAIDDIEQSYTFSNKELSRAIKFTINPSKNYAMIAKVPIRKKLK